MKALCELIFIGFTAYNPMVLLAQVLTKMVLKRHLVLKQLYQVLDHLKQNKTINIKDGQLKRWKWFADSTRRPHSAALLLKCKIYEHKCHFKMFVPLMFNKCECKNV